MSFDISKPYTTRDGREAKFIVAPDGKLHGWMEQGGHYYPEWWDENGRIRNCDGPNASDLVNVPEQRSVKVWLNCHEYGLRCFANRPFADLERGERIACIEREITFTIGEGLGDKP